MTLAKALKRKNRMASNIARIQQDIQRENSIQTDTPRKIDVEDLMKNLKVAIESLIKMKIAIFIDSTPMRENILKLSELKSRIVFLQGISTKEGKVSEYGEAPVEYSVAFDKTFVREEIELCENEIDNIQDELDKFNHTTEIDV